MSEQLYDAVEACLMAIEEGATLEKCLELYPEMANELRPTLEAAYAARSLAEVSVPVDAMNRSRTRLLGKAALMRSEKQPKRVWMGLSRLAFSILLAVVLLVVSSSSLLAASAKSLPGDKLYPVKRAVQSLRVQFAPSGVQKYEAESEYRQQRIGEVQELIAIGHQRAISYEGVVEKIAETDWLVGGIEVRLTDDTVITGQITVGMLVEVEGTTELDGYVSAREIHLREFQFSGVVDSITRNEWVISGMRLKIVPETQIGPYIGVGNQVIVLARSDNDAEWKAMAILSLSAQNGTATPTPVMTNKSDMGTTDNELETEIPETGDNSDSGDDKSTPEPEETDDDSDSGDDQSTPEPEATDDDSDSGDDESTPEPKATGDDSTSDPEETDDSSGSGGGESTDEPDETDEPEEDDDGTSTPEETEEPEATPTPDD